MVRENARWKKSSEHKGHRTFNGKRYQLHDSRPTKALARHLAKKLKAEGAVSIRITKSLYYGDWNVWLRPKR